MVEIVFGLIEQAVSQTCTDNHAEEAVEKQRVELLLIYLAVYVLLAHHEIRQCDAHYPQ